MFLQGKSLLLQSQLVLISDDIHCKIYICHNLCRVSAQQYLLLLLIQWLSQAQPYPPLSQPDCRSKYPHPEQSPCRLFHRHEKPCLSDTLRRHAQSPFGQILHTVCLLPLCPCKTHTTARHAPCVYKAWCALQYTCSKSLNSMRHPFFHPLSQRTG